MAGEDYTAEQTARASERFTDVMPAAYDEKDNMDLLREKLQQRKKPIYAGLAFLCVVVIGVSVIVASTGSTEASTSSAQTDEVIATPAPTTAAPIAEEDAGGVHAADDDKTLKSESSSGSGSVAGEAAFESDVLFANQTSPEPSTETPTPSPDGPILPYHALDFDWKDPSNWEYSSGAAVPADMFADGGIKLTPANSAQPIRTKQGWGGEKIVYIEWERSETSDTNIWMLNTKLQDQFGVGNGWPYWGELDIFEMFTQDATDKSFYDFSGFQQFGATSSYGQLTLHNGPRKENGDPCFCPASHTKSAWFKGQSSMTSGCTAQFENSAKNAMATVWGRDGSSQYLQLFQKPTVTKGGKLNDKETYDVVSSGTETLKILNNKEFFWGTPSSAPCATGGGHNPDTGFPFFEDFRLILEEQKKGDGSAWFKVTNVQIFVKN